MVRWLTEDLPGSGGTLEASTDDFIVHEIPSYLPSGQGEHLLLEIEKVGLTTPEAAKRLAAALSVREHEVGYAGLKDKDARTRQWVSMPWAVKKPLPEWQTLEIPDVRILSANRHINKLRRGHQRGNRFQLTIRHLPEGGLDRARAILERLIQVGVPNAFGPQRFGRDGDNVEQGLAILRGTGAGPRNRRIRGLLLSAVQSEAFNRVLDRRMAEGLLSRALLGDVMQKHDTNGLFDVTDPEAEQPRVDRLEISPTAALPGPKVRKATAGWTDETERSVWAELGLEGKVLAGLDDGTRRTLRYPLRGAELSALPGAQDAFMLDVSLPSGSYATVLLAEIMKPEGGVVLRGGAVWNG